MILWKFGVESPQHLLPNELSVPVQVYRSWILFAGLGGKPQRIDLGLLAGLNESGPGEYGFGRLEVLLDDGVRPIGGGAIRNDHLVATVLLTVDRVQGSEYLFVVSVVARA